MFVRSGLAALAVSVLAFLPSAVPASAADPAPGTGVTLKIVSVAGTGCPKGTAAVGLSPDNTAFTVTYSAFDAQVGPTTTILERSRSCRITMLVNIPLGYTYAVSQVDLRGFASIAAGASAAQTLTYFFTGLPTAQISHALTGPYEDDWQTSDSTPVKGLSYAPCGLQRLMTINTNLKVAPGTSNTRTTTSFITMDSTDGSVSTRYRLAWKSCR